VHVLFCFLYIRWQTCFYIPVPRDLEAYSCSQWSAFSFPSYSPEELLISLIFNVQPMLLFKLLLLALLTLLLCIIDFLFSLTTFLTVNRDIVDSEESFWHFVTCTLSLFFDILCYLYDLLLFLAALTFFVIILG
jgi:hypothetical protein